MGKALGRPTAYNGKETCDIVRECGRQGYTVNQIASKLDVHKDTLYEWRRVHPEFSDAFTRARRDAQSVWEGWAMDGMLDSKFQANLWLRLMPLMFEDYRRVEEPETPPDADPIRELMREVEERQNSIADRVIGRVERDRADAEDGG